MERERMSWFKDMPRSGIIERGGEQPQNPPPPATSQRQPPGPPPADWRGARGVIRLPPGMSSETLIRQQRDVEPVDVDALSETIMQTARHGAIWHNVNWPEITVVVEEVVFGTVHYRVLTDSDGSTHPFAGGLPVTMSVRSFAESFAPEPESFYAIRETSRAGFFFVDGPDDWSPINDYIGNYEMCRLDVTVIKQRTIVDDDETED
jgi:hypothetical protein